MRRVVEILVVLAAHVLVASCAHSSPVMPAAGFMPSGVSQDGQAPHAGMLRYPDVSAERVVFAYANDLWTVPRQGGQATPLASPPGAEMFPRFNPDGSAIVFQGNYAGDRDLYTLPVAGGVPQRLTHHPANETPTDWAESGIIYHMGGAAGLGRQQEIYRVGPEGGLPERLPVPYGANGALSPDGQWLAYTPNQRDFRTWKRYRGGMASDVWLFNIQTLDSRRITDWEGTDTLPMWHGSTVYYLSDQGEQHRLNIWAYDVATSERTQLTDFADYDVKFPAIGPGDQGQGEIVFQNGPRLYLLDLASNERREVAVTIPGAKPTVRPRIVDAAEHLQAGAIGATGKRVAVEARGDIWTLPAENGPPRQLTATSGVAERNPAWSPSGRWIAYASDEGGEYNLYITQSDGKGETRRLTDMSGNYWMALHWSPDSGKLLAVDKAARMHLIDIESGERTEIDKDPWASMPAVSWSGDSRWIAYHKGGENPMTSAIWIYDTQEGVSRRVTSGFFADTSPAFSRTGDYLYYASARDFTSPQYEDVGSTFVYDNTQRIIAVPLNADVENAQLLESDEETWEQDGDEAEDGQSDDRAEPGEDAQEEDGQEEDAADAADDEDQAQPSPVEGVWAGVASGLAALGLPEDELEYTFYIQRLEDGSYVGASEAQGELRDYDSVSFDEDTNTLTTTSTQGPMTTKSVGTLSGETITGTWTITGPIEGSGPFEATRQAAEVPEGTIKGAAAGGAKAGEPVEIDFDRFEARGRLVPVPAGGLSALASNDKGQLLYNRSGGAGAPPSVRLVDMTDDEPEERTVITGATMVGVSGDGKKVLLAGSGNRWKVADARPGQSLSDAITPDGLYTRLDPRAEWRQLLTDAWRRHRDFFYVENMHGVDWPAVLERYSAMLDDAASREDVGFLIGEMISELNVGHAYYWGGDVEQEPSRNVGMLGVDFELAAEGGRSAYRIARIYEGAPWDTDARNPLTQPGMDVAVGDLITHVNGRPIDTDRDPWAAFIGTAGRPTTITVADALTGDDQARNERTYTIEPMASDQGLRFRAWVEANRQYVDRASDGAIGYIYVPDTGVNGQNELFRQFYGQAHKQALIIDDRWNGGGQIPTRFVELLNRPRTNYWYRRDGKDWPWPYDSHQGPKAMLINGSAGSGGDMFPWLFKHNGLGPLIGTRTWGGLVGISGVPPLIDGGYTAVPNFGFYETDGTWGIEGHGVDPDIRVVDDPTELATGADPQIDAAVAYLLEAIEREGYQPPEPPQPPDRSGLGIAPEDR